MKSYNSKINRSHSQLQQTPIAIIGMASIFAQARTLQEYWTNIVNKIDCITDVPASHWSVEDYYDPDPKKPDKTYSKRGGFIPDVDFNPMEFGLPPHLLEVTDISQILGLVVAKEAMEDAGYGESRQFDRERTGVVLGVAQGRQIALPLGARLQYPVWEKVLKSSGLSDEDTQKIVEKIKTAYVSWNENAFPGMLANIVSGRIANRLDLGGMNCVVDAACASSLGALKMAVSELTEYRSDMMITGGVDTDNSILAYMAFSKTPAVTPSDHTKPFDADADGMMLGEGLGMLVLKRLEDAVRDNDKIYAVIKGIGTSSDGRFKSIYAPRPEGQLQALRRAYEDAGISPVSVSLIEAHGTGTMAGDPSEFAALKDFFGEDNPKQQHIALGSVKSQIGHTKSAAGAASLIKTALALHHKILPPTINVTKPNPKLKIETTPFYLNTETRPWMLAEEQEKRRAGVSSFGFGGTNYHVVMEEYQSEHDQAYRIHRTAQILLLAEKTPQQLLAKCSETLAQLQSDHKEQYYAELIAGCQTEIPPTSARVGFVAESLTEACKLLQTTIDWLKNKPEATAWEHPQGIHYRSSGMATSRKVVALFSGQGSQYLQMGKELLMNFPEMRQSYGEMDRLLHQDGLKTISEVVFPNPDFDPDQKKAQDAMLQRTEYAQPAIGALSVGLYNILQQAGFKPDFVAGHSFGEVTALWAAGVLSDEDYFFLVKSRGQAMAARTEPNFDPGRMLAVKEDVSRIEPVLKDFPQVSVANYNSQRQVVLAGSTVEIGKVQQALRGKGFATVLLPVAAAFHTPLMGNAQSAFAQASAAVAYRAPSVPVYTNVTGKPYPTDAQSMRKILEIHLSQSVLFNQEIENIYGAGGYCFVEFGPMNILTNLVKEILGDKPHLAVALNGSRQQNSDRCLREAVVKLRVAGLSLSNIDPYQIPVQAPATGQSKLLSVKLNSTNFASEKTKAAFEKALQDGYKVTLPATTTISAMSAVSNGNEKEMPSTSDKLLNSQGVLDSLENTLSQFIQYQRETLQVHGQYLNHQREYTKTFCQLTQQQNTLLGGKSSPKTAEIKLAVADTLERSMMQFHSHHSETLRIHEQYLQHQAEYSNHFFQGIQQQYSQIIHTESVAPIVLPATPLETDAKQVATLAKSNPLETNAEISELEEPKQLIPEETLHVEKEVASTPSTTIDFASFCQALLGIISDKTGYPVEMLEIDMDMEADLGIDSIKRVEILGSVQEMYPELANPNLEELAELRTIGQVGKYLASYSASVVPADAPDVEVSLVAFSNDTQMAVIDHAMPSATIDIDLTKFDRTLLAIVSDKTGYPVEMLELDMEMEADLGINFIKQVEILEVVHELYPNLPKPNPEELRTIGQIVEYIQASAEVKKKSHVELDKPHQQLDPNIVRSVVKLKALSKPDFWDFALPEGHIGLITDDGSLTAAKLAHSLTEKGWKVVLLSLPQSVIADSHLSTGVNRVVLADLSEEHLQQQLAAIATKYGAIAAFIHLNPPYTPTSESLENLFSTTEAAILKHVFLIAKHLKEPLNQSATQGNSCFFTVTRQDGELGTTGNINSAIAGGL